MLVILRMKSALCHFRQTDALVTVVKNGVELLDKHVAKNPHGVLVEVDSGNAEHTNWALHLQNTIVL